MLPRYLNTVLGGFREFRKNKEKIIFYTVSIMA